MQTEEEWEDGFALLESAEPTMRANFKASVTVPGVLGTHENVDYGFSVIYVNFEKKHNRHMGRTDDLLSVIFRESNANYRFLEDLAEGHIDVEFRVTQYIGEEPAMEYVFEPKTLMYMRKNMHAFSNQAQEVRFSWIGTRRVYCS